MIDLKERLKLLPVDLAVSLQGYSNLPQIEKLALKEKVLKIVVTPQFKERMIALGLAVAISSKYKLLSDEKQAELAGSLLGGHLGYISVEIIKDLANQNYIADNPISSYYMAAPLEESLIAALGGMFGSQSLINPNRKGLIKGYSKYFQVYNLYTAFVYLLPVVLRASLVKQFDRIFVGAQ